MSLSDNPLVQLAREKREVEASASGKKFLTPQTPASYIRAIVRMVKLGGAGGASLGPRSGVYQQPVWNAGLLSGQGQSRMGKRGRGGRWMVRNKPKRPIVRSEEVDVDWTLPTASPEAAARPSTPGRVKLVQEGSLDPSKWHFTRESMEDVGPGRRGH